MNRTMKAAVVHAFGKPLTIEEVDVPPPGAHEVLVKIEACGVCHTDLHAAEGDWPVKPTVPFIPGHEGVGHVAAVGADVGHVKEGDRVGIPWLYLACGHCEHCLGGWETLCEQQKNTGYSVNGSFAQYALANSDYIGHLPGSVGFAEVAPVLCAGVTVYKGLKVTDTKPGNWVVISGIGGLGHMAVQYVKAMGLNVAAVDVDDSKLDLARRLGGCRDGQRHDQRSGRSHQEGDRRDIFGMVLNGITVRGSIVGTRLDLQESLDFVTQGKVRATVSTDKLENISRHTRNAVLPLLAAPREQPQSATPQVQVDRSSTTRPSIRPSCRRAKMSLIASVIQS
jgi:alcohol dehydrogenase, propanol-preferring